MTCLISPSLNNARLGSCSRDGPVVPFYISGAALFLQRCLEMLGKERNGVNGQWLSGTWLVSLLSSQLGSLVTSKGYLISFSL